MVIYQWPAIVIQRLGWLPTVGVLVDIENKLGRLAIRGRTPTVRAALESAGFVVIEVRRQGGEKPTPLARDEGDSLDPQLPQCVLSTRPSQWWRTC
jgi:hypothetical protein